MIVFGSTLSPYVRKCMVFGAEKGLDLELQPAGMGRGGPDFQAAISRGLDLIQRQTINVEHTIRCLDVQLHEIEERCTSAYEPHVRTLLGRLRLRRGRDCGCLIGRANELKSVHRQLLC